jgi:hypothetical protein
MVGPASHVTKNWCALCSEPLPRPPFASCHHISWSPAGPYRRGASGGPPTTATAVRVIRLFPPKPPTSASHSLSLLRGHQILTADQNSLSVRCPYAKLRAPAAGGSKNSRCTCAAAQIAGNYNSVRFGMPKLDKYRAFKSSANFPVKPFGANNWIPTDHIKLQTHGMASFVIRHLMEYRQETKPHGKLSFFWHCLSLNSYVYSFILCFWIRRITRC